MLWVTCCWEDTLFKVLQGLGVDRLPKLLNRKISPKILTKKLFYTAPAVKAPKMTGKLFSIGMHLSTTKSICEFQKSKENEYKYQLMKSFEDIDLLIVDEIDRLKLQSLEQIRAL